MSELKLAKLAIRSDAVESAEAEGFVVAPMSPEAEIYIKGYQAGATRQLENRQREIREAEEARIEINGANGAL